MLWTSQIIHGIVSCYKAARHMNDTLKLLYDRFYITLPMPAAEAEIEICHRQLIEHLEKPDRKLILRIIDAQNLIAEKRSIDSFICGFHLALTIAKELGHYMQGRNLSSAGANETDCS